MRSAKWFKPIIRHNGKFYFGGADFCFRGGKYTMSYAVVSRTEEPDSEVVFETVGSIVKEDVVLTYNEWKTMMIGQMKAFYDCPVLVEQNA